MTLDFLVALAFIRMGHPCDRCGAPSKFAVLCINNCYHTQCEGCAIHTDNERRQEERVFAWMN